METAEYMWCDDQGTLEIIWLCDATSAPATTYVKRAQILEA